MSQKMIRDSNQCGHFVDDLQSEDDKPCWVDAQRSHPVPHEARSKEMEVHEEPCPTGAPKRSLTERPAQGRSTLFPRSSKDGPGLGDSPCPRCRGLLVPVQGEALEFRASVGHACLSWRCVNCGEWIDPLIGANRRIKPGNVNAASRPRLRW